MSDSTPYPVAVVTGATRGIGRQIAIELAEQGYDIAFNYRNQADAESLQSEIESRGQNVFCAPLDFSNFDGIAHFFDAVYDKFKALDLLVNNAGITKDGLLASMPREDLQKIININLLAPVLCAKEAIKIMIPQKRGSIVNISSISATKPNSGQTNYAASKSGIEGFTRALAVEVAKKNIRVNCIAPGVIETDMVSDLLAENKQVLKTKLLSKRYGQPSDISRMVNFLSSPDNAFITGEVFSVNGGMLLK
ncbi:MAG: SDR family oxidoreductase [Colwellia sp.]|nr:SDR family oxidoreductase [Colwellia sp.]